MTTPEQALARLPEVGPGGRYLVAFSGGLDSTVLLHALVAARPETPVAAVHVHHGLQAQADDWVEHCRRQCAAVEVSLEVIHVRVGRGGEAAAREARYDALAQAMRSGDVALTAHHADDQAETFLLQAVRGAGVAGLAAMPAVKPFGPGYLARPFLQLDREWLRRYARAHNLAWVEDPSNADLAVDRSRLRRTVMPALAELRPRAAAGLRRSAAAAAEGASLADEIAAVDAAACAGPAAVSLDLDRVATLSSRRRRNLLRRWPVLLGLPAPAPRQLAALEDELIPARGDAMPVVRWPGAEVRRYRRLLFAMAPLPEPPAAFARTWDGASELTLPPGCGRLAVESAAGSGLRADAGPLTVRLRGGGERLRLPGRQHRAQLKNWLQESGTPPWVRERLPLIYAGGRLAAVGDWLVCEGFAAPESHAGRRLRWLDSPPGSDLVRVVGTSQFG